MKTKNCRVCKEDKILELDFYKQHDNADGYRGECKACRKSYHKGRHLSPKGIKHHYLKRTYSITLEDYNKMREEQNFSCFICSTPEESLKRPLLVDHCHSTGKNRNLLCDRCNTMLGKLEENVKIMENMIDYIKKHKS